MSTAEIQRQYNEVIAANYDLDPQFVTCRSLERAVGQLRQESCLSRALPPLGVLDLGMGTGLFLAKLRDNSEREIRPYGLDLSEKMVEIAKARIPDLVAVIDDAANIDQNFDSTSFDLICTHFVTGFVPMEHLAPRIWSKLKPGGYWSFVGAASTAFPQLQRLANNRVLRALFGNGQRFDAADLLTPADFGAVARCFEKHSLETCAIELFKPEVVFNNFDGFMDFAYRGGWLTPFIEGAGLHHAGSFLRGVLNTLIFPMRDCHHIVLGLARRPCN